MKKYIKRQLESGEVYIESTSHGYPNWWREFKESINESNTLSELNSRLSYLKTSFGLLPKLVSNIAIFNPFIFDFLTNNPDYLQCFYNGHIEGKKEFKKTYFIKYPNEQQIKVITRKFNDEFKETILFGESSFNKSNVRMAGFRNGILTAYWQFENSFLENQYAVKQTREPILNERNELITSNTNLALKNLKNNFDTNNNESLNTIKHYFKAMDNKGYQYAFRSEDDFNIFCALLASYFDNGTFGDIETIYLNARSKTKTLNVLNTIYSRLIKNDMTLKTNKDFFKIVRFLHPYKDSEDLDIYKALIR